MSFDDSLPTSSQGPGSFSNSKHIETRVGEISRDDARVVEVITDADKFLNSERLHRGHLIRARREDRDAELLFPFGDNFRLAFVTEQHERRCPRRMNQIDLVFRQLGDLFFIRGNRRLKFFDLPMPHVIE